MRLAAILLCAFWLAGQARGEVIDRVAVIVGREVIAESEILRQIRMTAFQNGEKPDVSPENKRTMADKLVDQLLIRHEIETNRYALGEPASVEAELARLKKSRFANDADYRKALQDASLTEDELKQQLQWQLTLVPFVDARFRPGIQIPEAEIKEYYEKRLLPNWTRQEKSAPPTLEEASSAIEAILTSERADQALDRWLGQMRAATKIRYRDEVFQ